MSASNKRDKDKRKEEPPVTEHGGRYICRAGDRYRVKTDPTDSYSLHHGSFGSAQEARDWIDEMRNIASFHI